MVLESRKRQAGGRELDLFLHHAKISVVPLTEEHFEIARQAWRKYGKGNHAAGLNLADCCAYALAKTSGEPLLFKGDDFRKTDIAPALQEQHSEIPVVFQVGLSHAYRTGGFFNVPQEHSGRFGRDRSDVHMYLCFCQPDLAPL